MLCFLLKSFLVLQSVSAFVIQCNTIQIKIQCRIFGAHIGIGMTVLYLRLHDCVFVISRLGEMILEVEENVPETGMSVEVESEIVTGTAETLYCFCQKPWGKDFMIMCDNCKEWFHGALVNFDIFEDSNLWLDFYLLNLPRSFKLQMCGDSGSECS